MIIVIDGPSGSGKSTLAKQLAKELKMPFFDTGAMYRSFCWYLMQQSIDMTNEQQVQKALEHFNYEVKYQGLEGHFFVNDQDVSEAIRQSEIDQNVSLVSAYLPVRQKMVEMQRKFAKNREAIFEGRDMGTVVFPKAEVKFFLIADVQVRAQRRYEQIKAQNPHSHITYESVEKDLKKRDEYDSSRKHSPLKEASDAIKVDATHLTVEQVLDKMKSYVEEIKA